VATETREELEAVLAQAGGSDDAGIDIAETALALAALDRPRLALDFYRSHLAQLVEGVARQAGGGDIDRAVAALAQVLAVEHGYKGDRLTYDDMQNANLMRVIDRRRGLPVALGILFMHAARGQGWRIDGLAFPAHFLVRLEVAGGRAILDPFEGGRALDTVALRQLLKAMHGSDAELGAEHYAIVGTREVLLRLQNNIKSRALQANDARRAREVLQGMVLFAPQLGQLHRELALVEAWLGNFGAALAAGEAALARATGEAERQQAALLLQQLRQKLN